jgi:hypothetical protein
MMKRLFRIGLTGFLAGLMSCVWAAEVESYADWARAYADVATREELSEADRLLEQTRLFEQAMEAQFPLSGELWTAAADLLVRWEASPEIDLAREAYVALLLALCGQREGIDEPMPDEGALRNFLQRALSLTRSPQEEGALLLYLAESWIRTSLDSQSLLRRAESLLQQAATILGGERPLDAVHIRLGQLYEKLGKRAEQGASGSRDAVFFTRAATHYETALQLPFIRERFIGQAELALVELRKPELEINVNHRFLPGNDIRLTLRSRNIESVEVRLVSLPAGEAATPLSLMQLSEALAVDEPLPEQIRFLKEFPTLGRYPHDWREHEIRLDSTFVGSWYGIRIRGGGVTAEDLVLITPLEVAAFPRQDGSLLVWIADGETGQPVPLASISVFGEDGSVLASALSGMDGTTVFPAESVGNWSEVHVMSDPNPGHLRRADLPVPEAALPWVVTNPSEILPGATLQWAVLGLDQRDSGLFDPGPEFILPDGTLVRAETTAQGEGWLAGSLQVPDTLTEAGPVYVLLPQGIRLFVGHVRFRKSFPLDLDLSGEQLAGAFNLFLASSPVGVSITPALGAQGDVPDFIRLRVLTLSREPGVINPDSPLQIPPALLFETILPFDADSPMETLVELPDLSSSETIRPLKVEVLPLDGTEPLGVTWFGLMPFRRLVELGVQDQIVRPNEPAVITFFQKNIDESDRRATEGELVVYRETWQNRYIHRRRGTPLSESEYRALPDRSLLGAAKTDFRLVEEGFIREELRRIPLEVTEEPQQVSIPLERPGYYNIEFAGREVDARAYYPDGPLEVWVVSASSDLRAFRSDEPRLIMEDHGDQLLRVLILLDRTDPVVLCDIETEEGTRFTQVSKPDHAALYFEVEQSGPSGPATARALIVGDRRTEFIGETSVPELAGEWELPVENLFGMNPGVPFSWNIISQGEPPVEPVLWTFYADNANLLTPARLRWQQELQQSTRHHPQSGASFLSQWLPFSIPFGNEVARAQPHDPSLSASLIDPELFLGMFPEVIRFSGPASQATPFQPVVEFPEAGQFGISGNFPSTAGRWDLTVMSAAGHHQLKVDSWLISTELPIRSSIQGPDILRLGDRAILPLTLENTTEEPAVLTLVAPDSPIVEMDIGTAPQVELAAGQLERVSCAVTALSPGTDTLDVRVEGSASSSEAVHPLRVIGPSTRSAFSFYLARPEAAESRGSLDLANWTQADLLIVPGIGALLPEIWPAIRDAQDSADPLLTALGQWALEHVLKHHGVTGSGDPSTASAELAAALQERQVATGGWGWLPDGEADPWMSAFITWTLGIFGGADPTVFPEFREQGQRYLESVLIDDSVDAESQLFALRALAMPAFHSDTVRPSRIQARTFLDYLHRQEDLPDAGVAILLQVAKAYGFKQEVSLLTDELLKRNPGERRFWLASLVYLALDDNATEVGGGSFGRLLIALKALERRGPARSWEQVGGFLNLLAAYYWKGDFYSDGEVSVSVEGGPSLPLSLNPEVRAERLLKVGLDLETLPERTVSFSLDMRSALSPVLVAAVGHTAEKAVLAPMESAQTRFYREYFETTLLKGSRSRSVELGDALSGLQVGDNLRVVLVFDLTERQNFARFEFPVPAGMRLGSEGITHSLETPFEAAAPPTAILQSFRESTEQQVEILSMGPLPAGRHTFNLSFKALWGGSYNWPGSQMLIPEKGTIHELTEDRQVTIAAEGD